MCGCFIARPAEGLYGPDMRGLLCFVSGSVRRQSPPKDCSVGGGPGRKMDGEILSWFQAVVRGGVYLMTVIK